MEEAAWGSCRGANALVRVQPRAPRDSEEQPAGGSAQVPLFLRGGLLAPHVLDVSAWKQLKYVLLFPTALGFLRTSSSLWHMCVLSLSPSPGSFWVWLLSLSSVSSGSPRIVAGGGLDCDPRGDGPRCVYPPPTDRHLGCLCLLAIVDAAGDLCESLATLLPVPTEWVILCNPHGHCISLLEEPPNPFSPATAPIFCSYKTFLFYFF